MFFSKEINRQRNVKHLLLSRLVVSRFFDISGNLGNVKEKPARKNCYCPVCVCVCVCVCVYTLPPVDFFRLHDVFDIREKFGSTIFCCEYSVSFCQVPSSLFLNLISPPETKTPANRLLERKQYDIMFGIRRKDYIYWYRK